MHKIRIDELADGLAVKRLDGEIEAIKPEPGMQGYTQQTRWKAMLTLQQDMHLIAMGVQELQEGTEETYSIVRDLEKRLTMLEDALYAFIKGKNNG